jgi:hypothetical protein
MVLVAPLRATDARLGLRRVRRSLDPAWIAAAHDALVSSAACAWTGLV